MFKNLSTILFLMSLLVCVQEAKVQPRRISNFSSYPWIVMTPDYGIDNNQYNQPYGFHCLIHGYDGKNWYDASDTAVYVDPSDGTLHLKLQRKRNLYAHPDSATFRDNLHAFAVWFNLFGPSQDRPTIHMLDSVVHLDTVWFNTSVTSDTVFRYGKYRWEIVNRIDTFPEPIDPGLWIWDSSNFQRGFYNEIDFEFCPFSGPNGSTRRPLVSVFPTYGLPLDPTGNCTHYAERNENIPFDSLHQAGIDNSTHEFVYKPQSVIFRSFWDTDSITNLSTWGITDTTRLRTFGEGYDPSAPECDSIRIPPCGYKSTAIMSMLTIGYPSNYTGPNTIEMVVKSFHHTGIPDLTFFEKTDNTIQGNIIDTPWAPSNWSNKPIWVTDSDSPPPAGSAHRDTVNAGQLAYLHWAVHNTGTAPVDSGTLLQSWLYVENDLIKWDTTRLNRSIPVDTVYSDSFPCVFTQWGMQHYRFVFDSLTVFDELRKTNNAYICSVYIRPTDLAMVTVTNLPAPAFWTHTSSVTTSDTLFVAGDTAYLHWTAKNVSPITAYATAAAPLHSQLQIDPDSAVHFETNWTRTVDLGSDAHWITHQYLPLMKPGRHRFSVTVNTPHSTEDSSTTNNSYNASNLHVLGSDLSFTDTLGQPWHPDEWESALVTSSFRYSPTEPHLNRFLNVGDSAFIYWAAHNIGNSHKPAGYRVRTRIFVNDVQVNETITNDSLAIGADYRNNGFGTVFTTSGDKIIRVETSLLDSLGELTTANNTVIDTVPVYAITGGVDRNMHQVSSIDIPFGIDAGSSCYVETMNHSNSHKYQFLCGVRTSIQVIDVTNPYSPVRYSPNNPNNVYSIAVDGDYVYALYYPGTYPGNPWMGKFHWDGSSNSLNFVGSYELCETGEHQFSAFTLKVNHTTGLLYTLGYETGTQIYGGLCVWQYNGGFNIVANVGPSEQYNNNAKLSILGSRMVTYDAANTRVRYWDIADTSADPQLLTNLTCDLNDMQLTSDTTLIFSGTISSQSGIYSLSYRGSSWVETGFIDSGDDIFMRILRSGDNCFTTTLDQGIRTFDYRSKLFVTEKARINIGIDYGVGTTAFAHPFLTNSEEYISVLKASSSNNSLYYVVKQEIPTVFSPNGGEQHGGAIPVTWNGNSAASNPSSVTVEIALDGRDSTTWANTSTTWSNESNDGSGSFTPRRRDDNRSFYYTDRAKVAIRLNNAPYTCDTSDAAFTYGDGFIQTSSPIIDAYIGKPVTIPTGDTVVFAADAIISFADSGKIVVPTGSCLTFETEEGSCTRIEGLTGSFPTNWAVIEVQSGGKVQGKNIRLENLPTALSVNGGKVFLDSTEFVDCTTAIEAGSLNDTLSVTNSSFTGGTKAIHAKYSANGVLALSHCAFDSQSVRALDVQASDNIDSPGLVDSCTFSGVDQTGTGIYLENCDANFHFMNSIVENWWHGVETTLSNPQFDGSYFQNNGKSGIRWSNDFPGTSSLGRIENCHFEGNGNGSYGVGYYGYAASTVLVCNQFDTELGYGAHCVGTPSPYFYDPDAQTDGANSFYGSEAGFPLVYLTENAEPTFLYGKNYFLLADSSAIVAEDGSTTPLSHDLKDNNYGLLTVTIDNFVPNDDKLWNFPDCEGGTCEAQMMSLPEGESEKLLLGDIAAADGNDSAAVQYYNNAIELSGDTTGVGASALARLAKLNPVLPPVGEELTTGAQYSATYAYDALGDFSTSDAYRDTILSTAASLDSIRVAYDVSVSALLRPSTMAFGPRAEAMRERAISRRSGLLDQLMTSGKKHMKSKSTQSIAILPTTYALHPVYPNPFNPITNIRFDLPEANHVKVSVYDAMGRLVTNLVDGNQAAGYHNVQWNGSTASSGVYFVTIHTNKYTATRKAVLLK